MNRKQVAILKQFLDRPAWQIAELTEGMSLSQSMVRHELRGVNDYLLRLGLPEIETARGGGLHWNAGEEQKKRLASELADDEITFVPDGRGYRKSRDVPVVLGTVIFVTIIVGVINLVVDLICALIDPRIDLAS